MVTYPKFFFIYLYIFDYVFGYSYNSKGNGENKVEGVDNDTYVFYPVIVYQNGI